MENLQTAPTNAFAGMADNPPQQQQPYNAVQATTNQVPVIAPTTNDCPPIQAPTSNVQAIPTKENPVHKFAYLSSKNENIIDNLDCENLRHFCKTTYNEQAKYKHLYEEKLAQLRELQLYIDKLSSENDELSKLKVFAEQQRLPKRKKQLDIAEILRLRSKKYSFAKIAKLMDVSEATIRKRLKEFQDDEELL